MIMHVPFTFNSFVLECLEPFPVYLCLPLITISFPGLCCTYSCMSRMAVMSQTSLKADLIGCPFVIESPDALVQQLYHP